MSFDGITEFVAVADSLSFTKAARELNVSAAHVSRKIHFLESKLGSVYWEQEGDSKG